MSKITTMVTLLCCGVSAYCSAETRYTMAAFTNLNQSNMYIFQSEDAVNFAPLTKGSSYSPEVKKVRDPSIIKHTDGKYWVTYTTDWYGKTIGFAWSEDRVNWTFSHEYSIESALGQSTPPKSTWAPEWFIDDDGTVSVIVSMDFVLAATMDDFTPYVLTATSDDFTSFTEPKPMKGFENANFIDTFVVKIGDTYHAMVKNEYDDSVTPGRGKKIEYATSESLTGPWEFQGQGDWAGWGENWVEGPALVKLDSGEWRIFFDQYPDSEGVSEYYYSDTTDFKNTGFHEWTEKKEIPELTGFIRHLTVLREELPAFDESTCYVPSKATRN